MVTDVYLIFLGWTTLGLWQIVGFPLVFQLYDKRAVDAAWGFGRLATWLTISVVIWWSSHLSLPTNQPLFVYLLFVLLGLLAVRFYYKKASEVKEFLKKKWPIVLTQEIIFLVFFVFLCVMRGYQPRIEGLEKFMDVGFIAGYLRSPTLPAEDMWLAGERVNYYTFGHFLGSIATQFWNVEVEYSYNMLLGVIMGLVATQTASLVMNLVGLKESNKKIDKRKSSFYLIRAGLLSAFLMVCAGNGHLVWYFLTNHSFKGYWYPDATRFIDRTIHEFPAYSFIVSDLHAHVWGIPLVLAIILAIFMWLNSFLENFTKPTLRQLLVQRYVIDSFAVGCLLGLAVITSTWDFLVYGLLLVLLGLTIIFIRTNNFIKLLFSALIMGVFAFLIASPWLLTFDSISEGTKIAQEQSPAWQLLVLWGPHVTLSVFAAVVACKITRMYQKIPARELMIVILMVTSLFLLLIPEIAYVKDIYPNHPRANTMFKLTFQAFIMMTLLVSWLSGAISSEELRCKVGFQWRLIGKMLLVVFVIVVSGYSFFGYRDFYGGSKQRQGLSGMDWMMIEMPGDYQLISWLRKNVQGRPVVLEAVGDSYTTFARVSTYSGMPTVLGWRVHEWLWRGGFDVPSKRTEEVKNIYEHPQSEQSKQLLDNYQVKYVVVGDKEREIYQLLDEEGLRNLGTTAFQEGNSYIIKLH